MRLIFTTILIAISNVIFCQLSGIFGIGYNQYTNNYKDYKRSNGITLQFGLEKELSDLFSLNYGINVSLANENYYEYYYLLSIDTVAGGWNVDKSKKVIEKTNNYSLSMQYPIVLVTSLVAKKLYITTGLSLNIDNLLILGSINTMDPEISNPNDYFKNNWPARGLGFGQQIGIIYTPTKKFALYGELKTTKNRTFGFSYCEIGIRYRIFTNR
jgi:hypothetical protein